ncbi:MAG: peptidoglycan bridge formation glycyltransferase FemA/FemB family protein [Anaerotruncus sp.]|nr:peptidoglycan bridge formation glycyltransferase FemA/FemB family protein [Anaerotruncus sp.]
MEILTPEQYSEYERFVTSHPQGSFTQSVNWQKVKNNWGFEAVVSRDDTGAIVGGCSVLIQKIPGIGTSFLYAPRGPVCDLHDRAVLEDLKAGIDQLAKKYNAHLFKMDPDVLMSDTEFLGIAKGMGFRQSYGPDGFEGIQARFNYRLYLNGRSEEELFANLTQKTRYNCRVAMKKGVEIRIVGKEYLDEFMRIMRTTGERDGFNIRPQAYFERMLDALGEHVRLYMGFYQNQPICGAITTNYAGKVCYVYGASDNVYRNVMPNYLIQWQMIQWAVETGCSVYDFQGVSGNMDENSHMYGLYRFKRGFNGSLDELAGEFDYIYQPIKAKLVDQALAWNGRLRSLKKRLGRK